MSDHNTDIFSFFKDKEDKKGAIEPEPEVKPRSTTAERPARPADPYHPRDPQVDRFLPGYRTPSDYDRRYFKDTNLFRILQEAGQKKTGEERLQALEQLWPAGYPVPPWAKEQVITGDGIAIVESVEYDWPFPWASGVTSEQPYEVVKQHSGLFARLGAKSAARERLVSMMPPCHTYVEPFAGSFKVFFWRTERAKIEILNDSAGQMINFWRYAQAVPEEIAERINSLPISESLFLDFHDHYDRLSPFMKAVAFYYVARLTYNGIFSKKVRGHSTYATSPASLNSHYIKPEQVVAAAERLRRVDIRCNDYRDVIKRANKKVNGGVFFYLDPPYYLAHGYREIGDRRDMGFGLREHYDLHKKCVEIDKAGNRFLQTNSDHKELRDLYSDFNILRMDVYYSVTGKREARRDTSELIITNYDVEDCLDE